MKILLDWTKKKFKREQPWVKESLALQKNRQKWESIQDQMNQMRNQVGQSFGDLFFFREVWILFIVIISPAGRRDSEDAVLHGKPDDVKSCLNVITPSQMSRDGFEPYKQLFDRLHLFIGSELVDISKPVQNAMLRAMVRYPKSVPTTWFDCLHFDCSKLGRSTARLLKCF